MQRKLMLCFCGMFMVGLLWSLLPADLVLARKIPAFFAAISMVSMALAMVISCRPHWLDRLVGGIDRAYRWHKWLGISGLLGACFHWMLVPGPAGNGISPQFAAIGEEVGEFAMYGLLLLAAVSCARVVPYRLWYYTHKLMGPIFLISVYHTFFSDVPFEVLSLTGLALSITSVVGLSAWGYNRLFKRNSYRQYRTVEVHRMGDAVEVVLEPVTDAIAYKAGQFAYIDFGYGQIEHFHPFTITSDPTDKRLSFVIRAAGAHTRELYSRLGPGQLATVDGGYGQLHARRQASQPQVWIAAGVGITPFLAWLQALKPGAPQVHLFYVGRGCFYRLMKERLAGLIQRLPVTLHLQPEGGERLTGANLNARLTLPLTRYQVFACGPRTMLDALQTQLKEQGMSSTQWHNERFEMR